MGVFRESLYEYFRPVVPLGRKVGDGVAAVIAGADAGADAGSTTSVAPLTEGRVL